MNRVLIIDDEPPARDALRALLCDHPRFVIAGEAGTLAESTALLARDDYDLVLLDVQLRGGTGFDLVPLVRPGARIIFVTAFDAHALRAFEVNAVDYLVKPVAPDRLAASLRRLDQPQPDRPPPTPPLALEDRILLKVGAGSARFVRLADIRYVASSENYSEIAVGEQGERLLVRKTIKSWEEILPPQQFVRIHRQMIVNLAHVRAINRVSDATSMLRLDGVNEPVPASYRYLAILRERLPG